MKKKILALILSLSIVLTLFAGMGGMTVSSATYNDFMYSDDGLSIIITGYLGPGGSVNIPSIIAGKPVNSIGPLAFLNCTSLTEIIIPNSVLSIGQGAFGNCINLINVTFGTNVNIIEKEAFAFCNSLTKIIIPDNVTIIEDNTFINCNSLTEIIIHSSVDNIGYRAFYGCPSLVINCYTNSNAMQYAIANQINYWQLDIIHNQNQPFLYHENLSSPVASDGKIMGTTSAMEYRREEWFDENTSEYIQCPDGDLTGLGFGFYYVRYAAVPGKLYASLDFEIIIDYPIGGDPVMDSLYGVPPATEGELGKIIGTTDDMECKLTTQSDDYYMPCTNIQTTGLIPGFYNVRYIGGNPRQNLVLVPENNNKFQQPPYRLRSCAATTEQNNDGKIIGTTADMEYKLSTESDYIRVIGTEITGLQPGTYNIRYAAKEGYNKSDDTNMVVQSYQSQPEIGLTFDNLNLNIGDIVTATVYLKDFSSLAQIQATIGWNPEVLTMWNKTDNTAATSYQNCTNDSAILSLTQNDVYRQNTTAFRYEGGYFNSGAGLVSLNYKSKLSTLPSDRENYYVCNPNNKINIVSYRFKVIGTGDANIRFAKKGNDIYYNEVESGYIINDCFYQSPAVGITENISLLTVNSDKLQQNPPTGLIAVIPSSAGVSNGKITGTSTTMQYRACTNSSCITVKGTEITNLQGDRIYKVRYAAIEGYDASPWVDVYVPKGPMIEQQAPTGLQGIAPSFVNFSDGKITGTNVFMEYKLSTESDYKPAKYPELTGLSAGTYYVRLKETVIYNASPVAIIIISPGIKFNSISAPTGLNVVDTSEIGGTDGKIINATPNMEYKLSSDANYFTCTGTEITGLSEGTYCIRYKENELYYSSSVAEIVISHDILNNICGYVLNGTTVIMGNNSTSSDVNGYFNFDDIEPGTYDIIISRPGAITRTIPVNVSNSNIALSTIDNKIDLILGDTNNDSGINVSDLSAVKSIFNKIHTDAGYISRIDVNQDNQINVSDLSMVKANFNKTAASYA